MSTKHVILLLSAHAVRTQHLEDCAHVSMLTRQGPSKQSKPLSLKKFKGAEVISKGRNLLSHEKGTLLSPLMVHVTHLSGSNISNAKPLAKYEASAQNSDQILRKDSNTKSHLNSLEHTVRNRGNCHTTGTFIRSSVS